MLLFIFCLKLKMLNRLVAKLYISDYKAFLFPFFSLFSSFSSAGFLQCKLVGAGSESEEGMGLCCTPWVNGTLGSSQQNLHRE